MIALWVWVIPLTMVNADWGWEVRLRVFGAVQVLPLFVLVVPFVNLLVYCPLPSTKMPAQKDNKDVVKIAVEMDSQVCAK